MSTESRTTRAARSAVAEAETKYGPGWAHVSRDARIGAAVVIATSLAKCYAPERPAILLISIIEEIADLV